MKNRPVKYGLILFCLMMASPGVWSGNFIVTNTGDSGNGSLRQALADADAFPGADTIIFNIPVTDAGFSPASGAWTIRINTLLPYLTAGNLCIDGNSQEVFSGNTNQNGPEIILYGIDPVTVPWAFGVFSNDNTIRGLVFNNFKYGILISESSGCSNLILENYFGTNYSGDSSSANQYGILITNRAHDNVVINNLISGNDAGGILLHKTSHNVITGNRIGCDRTGLRSVPNPDGILCDSSSSNIIGGNNANERNLISGNSANGILISSTESRNNVISGNYIGTDVSGTLKLPNLYGVSLSKANNNTIGANNVISGNTDIGILLSGKFTCNNIIKGNLIGLDASGTALLDNQKGIVIKSLSHKNIIGGDTIAYRNVISGNLEIGIYIEASDSNQIKGNYIGTDISGMNRVAKWDSTINDTLVQGNGVEFNILAKYNILGGQSYGERNIISGNKVYGVVYYGNCSRNKCVNNFIGPDAGGRNPLKNATGICFDCSSNHNIVEKCVISGNKNYGLFFVTRGTDFNRISGCLVGLDSAGVEALPNDIGMVISTGAAHNIVGGDSEYDRNVFSGNTQSGLMITNNLTMGNLVRGNFFGTDISGSFPVPNLYGIIISTFASGNMIDSNLISGNDGPGMIFTGEADSNIIIRNKIGTDVTALGNLGNVSCGLYLDRGSKNNLIGMEGCPNIIAYNSNGGILLNDERTRFNTISANSFFDNQGLGIDIFPFGIVNDTAMTGTGPQEWMPAPVIQSATRDHNSGSSVIEGRVINRNIAYSHVEIYIAQPGPADCGQGRYIIGTATPDASGKWILITDSLTGGEVLTALAIDEKGNTSEFSQNLEIIQGMDVRWPGFPCVNFFPNPCSDQLNIMMKSQVSGKITFSVFNSSGQVLCRENASGLMPGDLYVWDLKDDNGNSLLRGKYIIVLTFENGVSVSKLITVI